MLNEAEWQKQLGEVLFPLDYVQVFDYLIK